MMKKKEQLNCPNCGAPITGSTCDYCGSLFYDFANLELRKPSYLRLKTDDTLNIFRAVTQSVTLDRRDNEYGLYADDSLVDMMIEPETILTITMRILPDDKGILLERRKNYTRTSEKK